MHSCKKPLILPQFYFDTGLLYFELVLVEIEFFRKKENNIQTLLFQFLLEQVISNVIIESNALSKDDSIIILGGTNNIVNRG